jgi:hypothetical protein
LALAVWLSLEVGEIGMTGERFGLDAGALTSAEVVRRLAEPFPHFFPQELELPASLFRKLENIAFC